MMSGVDRIKQLRQAGFGEDEISQWSVQKTRELSDAGFGPSEVDAWFGKKEFNPKPLLDVGAANFERVRELVARDYGMGTANEKPLTRADVGPAEPVTDLMDVIEAGWGVSVVGLSRRATKNEGPPTKALAQDAPLAAEIAHSVALFAGDAPAMVAGYFAGGAQITGVAGAFALPAGLRSVYMSALENGEVKSFPEFWSMASGAMLETAKSWVTGLATGAAGKAAGAALPKTAGPLTRGVAVTAAEIGAMVTVGSTLEGEVPELKDFANAAIVIGGLKGSVHIAGKLKAIYRDTGVEPYKVLKDAEIDPTIRQDLLSSNKEMPTAYEGLTPKEQVREPAKAEAATSEAAKEPSTAQERVLARMAGESEKAPWRERLSETWNDFYTKRVDRLHPVLQLEKALSEGLTLETKASPYKLNRMLAGLFGRAEHWLEISPYKFDSLQNTGKSLTKILEPVRDDLPGFRAYALSSRALELHKRGIETGIDNADAAAVVRAGKAKHGAAFSELQEYQTKMLDYLRDSGILSKEAYQKMTDANKDYVPFYRLFGDEFGGKGAGAGLRVKNPIKAIKGSERQILDPMESIIKNTYLYLELAERNRANVALIELAEKSPVGADFVQRVKTKMRPIEVTDKEVAAFLKEHGIEGGAEAFTIFRPKGFNPRPDEIVVFRDGKAEVYKVNPEVAKALGPADAVTTALTFQVATKVASFLRAGAVLSPDFIARNPIRDQFSAFAFSRHGYIPVWDALRGIGGIFRESVGGKKLNLAADEHYGNWLKSGGANSTLVALDRAYIAENIFKLDRETGFLSNTVNVAKSPVEMLRVASELMENSTRLGAFKRAAKGATDIETTLRSGYESREVTLDFARIGAKMRALNMITAFQNAQIQGLDRSVRAFKENPQGTFVRVVASITMPSILLWWANHDDPRYKALPQWQKDLFWIVMADDAIYRIPKPFELGLLFGSSVERVLDAYYGENPEAGKDFAKTIFEAVTPGVVPTVLVPPVEQFFNKSMFTGRALIPRSVEGLLPEYQYQPYTTQAARAIGSLVGTLPGMKTVGVASPAVIENYVRGWSGGLGMYALQIADKSLREAGALPDPVKPTATLADIPFVKAFVVRYPSAQAKQIQDFYDGYYDLKQVKDTVDMLIKKGDQDAARREMNLRPEAMLTLDSIRDSLTKANRVVQMVYENPGMTPDDKRQIIDSTYYQMIQMAEYGNKLARETKKALGQ